MQTFGEFINENMSDPSELTINTNFVNYFKFNVDRAEREILAEMLHHIEHGLQQLGYEILESESDRIQFQIWLADGDQKYALNCTQDGISLFDANDPKADFSIVYSLKRQLKTLAALDQAIKAIKAGEW